MTTPQPELFDVFWGCLLSFFRLFYCIFILPRSFCIGFHCIFCVPRPSRIERYCILSTSTIRISFSNSGKSCSRIERCCISCITRVPEIANLLPKPVAVLVGILICFIVFALFLNHCALGLVGRPASDTHSSSIDLVSGSAHFCPLSFTHR